MTGENQAENGPDWSRYDELKISSLLIPYQQKFLSKQDEILFIRNSTGADR